MNLYVIKNKGLLFNFFRDGPTYNPTFITSANNGDTWSKESTHFIEDEVDGRNRPYANYMQLNDNAVGVAFTYGHPLVYGNSLYYASFDGKSYFNADGSKIKDLTEEPLKTSEAEKIFKGSEQHKIKPEGYGSVPDAAWTCEMEKDYTLVRTAILGYWQSIRKIQGIYLSQHLLTLFQEKKMEVSTRYTWQN